MMARVLIVHGHARSRADTAATLRAEGHDVLEAGSADNGVRMAHEQGPVSVILADMDGFAEVNERCGYAVGDRLLQAFAGRNRREVA
jgi:PleD family two-component response regulator